VLGLLTEARAYAQHGDADAGRRCGLAYWDAAEVRDQVRTILLCKLL
jgi:hypothetical protein